MGGNAIERINKQRDHWLSKGREQLEELYFASLDGNQAEHKKVLEDLGTTFSVLWRFDRKLRANRPDESGS